MASIGIESLPLGLGTWRAPIAPLAVSFFTFEFVHYLCKVRVHGREPIRNPVHFGIFAIFFPSLASGPIKRLSDFVSQLERLENPISTTLADFWRRWHMSLSSWIRDYIEIPLGGYRIYRAVNLLTAMFLCGLWHGAAWNFAIWGSSRPWARGRERRKEPSPRLVRGSSSLERRP